MNTHVAAAVLVAGWLANSLAGKDANVEAGILAYQQGRHDEALQSFDAATEQRGDRPEIQFNRGLALLAKGDRDPARAAFERASESEQANVRASAFYQLGNLAVDAEQWDAAIAHYVEALKAMPEHGACKWNLELALQGKREQDKKDREQDKDQQQQQDPSGEDKPSEKNQEENQQDQNDQDQNDQQDQERDREQEPEQKHDEEPPQEPPKQPDEPKDKSPDQQQQYAQPRELDRADIEAALEQLDAEDRFMLDRPAPGRVPRVEKDW